MEWIPLGLTDTKTAHKKSEEKIIEYMEKYGFSEIRGGIRYCMADSNYHLNQLKHCVATDNTNQFDKIREQLDVYPDLKDYFEKWDIIKVMSKK